MNDIRQAKRKAQTMKSTHLQGIGNHQAIEAADLKPGMVCVWNYGFKSEVLGVAFSKTGKTLTATLRSLSSGKVSDRKMAAHRLVAVA